ncbi:chemotaxis protein CheX [Limnoglobus roseus]|uniref:Chemotaxis phosphatase CheX-like domain-containing protein n=1 Tax=Limnoglobus roseus TaxID=2598579 RepID=A0A5C1A9I3_9BACT|nr:chemotaxis protein CheX [Limnoglobus roseus]QEL13774.1 hypothetical protein PX52LOC_00632 [Limnoglobus roseus]
MTLSADDIAIFAKEIWTLVLGQAIATSDRPLLKEAGLINSCVHITGAWRGTVVLVLPRAVAENAAAGMFAMDVAAMTQLHIHDAVGELVNMIGGNLKSLLPPPCFLSLPSVTHGQDVEMNIIGGRCLAKMTFETPNGVFLVAVMEHAADGHTKVSGSGVREWGQQAKLPVCS